jgi:hypothetical protein
MGKRNDDDGLIHHVLEEAEPADRITLVPIAISDSW